MKIPPFIRNKEITVRPYVGHTGLGTTVGNPVTLKVFAKKVRRVVTTSGEQNIVSSATIYADPADASKLVERSEVTLDGRRTKVLQVVEPSDLVGVQAIEALVE